MKGLLIEFDGRTGIRAGGIDPKDPALQCYGWQDLKSVPPKEIRVIEDDRNVEALYSGIDGVTILNNDAEIEAAITSIVKERYSINNEVLFRLDIEQRGILIKDLSGDVLKTLHVQGVKGIAKRESITLAETYIVKRRMM